MNPERKAEWVAALRSGEYSQGQSCLRSNSGEFCCLGVATDLAAKAGIGNWVTDDNGEMIGGPHPVMPGMAVGFRENGVKTIEYDTLPLSVAEWLGFSKYNNNPYVCSYEDHLASMNDSGYTFEQIADIIEQEF